MTLASLASPSWRMAAVAAGLTQSASVAPSAAMAASGNQATSWRSWRIGGA